MDLSQTFYKITNKGETFFEYKYNDGLNLLTEDFNDDLTKPCGKGGFYFTTLEHIHKFYTKGCYLRKVTLPKSVKVVQDSEKIRADMIILGKRYELCNVDTIKKFNLEIKLEIFRQANSISIINVLNWIKVNNIAHDVKYDSIVTHAIHKNYVDVLDYMYENFTFAIKFDPTNLLLLAARCGSIDILEWLKNKGDINNKIFDLHLADWASSAGHTNVLDWLEQNSTTFRYTTFSVDLAAEFGHMNVLNWFENRTYELKYTTDAVDNASKNGFIDVLYWFQQNQHDFRFTSYAIKYATDNKHTNILNWFKNNGYDTKYPKKLTKSIQFAFIDLFKIIEKD